MEDGNKYLGDLASFISAGGIMHLIDRFFLLRRERAEANKTSAEGDATVSAAWKEHVNEIQREAEQLRSMVEDLWSKRRQCEDALAAMSSEIIQLKAVIQSISRRADLHHEPPAKS